MEGGKGGEGGVKKGEFRKVQKAGGGSPGSNLDRSLVGKDEIHMKGGFFWLWVWGRGEMGSWTFLKGEEIYKQIRKDRKEKKDDILFQKMFCFGRCFIWKT